MKSSILATLTYTDIFDYPLTSEEIFRFLIGQHAIRNTQQEIKKQLAKNSYLISHVTCHDGYYCLRGREKIFPIRKQREKWSIEKLKIAKKVAGILRLIPWIKLIGITGGLARKNSSADDDIDLFFITAKNRLWLTRALIVLILRILRVYRRPNKIQDMICPNMLVSEDNLKIGPEDLFTAHEVCLMKPIFGQDNTYQKFLKENEWVKEFLPNISGDIRILGYKDIKNKKKENSLNLLISQSLNLLERFARDLQLWYMRDRRTTEIVSDNLIKFHPQDIREKVLREYQKRLNLLRFLTDSV